MQNGQTVGATEIQIGREDLQLIASDITARYGGNAYPKDFGELGQVGFDIVELKPGDTFGSLGHIHLAQEVVRGRELKIERVDYPHPPRVKLSEDFIPDNRHYYHPEDVAGRQVWLSIRKQQEEVLDQDWVLAELIRNGALPGSRVTVESHPHGDGPRGGDHGVPALSDEALGV